MDWLGRAAMSRRLSAQAVRQSLQAHSSLGLALAALLYLICLTGTLTVFHADFERWEQPDVPERLEFSAAQLSGAVDATLARLAQSPETIYLILPTADMPRLHVHAAEEEWLVTADGALGDALTAPWSDLVHALHVRLHLPETVGGILVGITGVMLISLLLSGILAHPALFRDAFAWRSGANGRLFHVDLHNRLGVWGAPFALMIALTGAFMGLAAVFGGGYAAAYLQNDRQAFFDMVYGADIEVAEASNTPVDFERALATLKQRVPAAEPIYIALQHPRTPRQYVEIAATLPGRLVFSEIYRFSSDGRYINHQALADGPAGRQVAYSVYRLHFGHFGDWPVQMGYGLLGLGLTVLCASGVNIWLTKRREQTRLNGLWIAWVWGWPVALGAAAVGALHGIAPGFILAVVLAIALALGALVREPGRLRAALLGVFCAMLVAALCSHLIRYGGVAGHAMSLNVNMALAMGATVSGVLACRSAGRMREIAGPASHP